MMDVAHLETGIYIRELKDGKWQKLDLSELTVAQRENWYAGLTKEGLTRIVEQYVEMVQTLDAYFPRDENQLDKNSLSEKRREMMDKEMSLGRKKND